MGILMKILFVFIEDMLVSGLIQCAQKLSTQYGDCLALISFGPSGVRALPVAAGTNEVGHYF